MQWLGAENEDFGDQNRAENGNRTGRPKIQTRILMNNTS